MTALSLLHRWTAPARKRSFLNAVAIGTPLAVAMAFGVERFQGIPAAVGVAALALVLLLAVALRQARRHDRAWLIHRLDARRPDMEDSAALLFTRDDDLNPLQRLQQARLQQRLDEESPEALAPAWQGRLIALCWIAAAVAVAGLLLWPRPDAKAPILAPSNEAMPAIAGLPRLTAQNLRIIPPAYTGLPVRDSASLDARVPAGSRVEWTLRFTPQASAPRLLMLGGQAVPLRRDGQNWIAGLEADAPFLYRVDAGSGSSPTPPLHRIDTVADTPPQVKAIAPASSLTMVTAGQKSWNPVFVATDDHGVAPTARLRITLAIGEGENVTFSEREIPVAGAGSARERRFAPRLDFSTFGFAAGGDMVVQLIVRDNRAPTPQEARSPSLILRWPSPKQPESSGLQGMVNTTLPAYFRSQRQIIIDAEALIKRKGRLSADRYLTSSAAIGADQQILRGRYSQFLGGEEEGTPEVPDGDGHGDGDGHDHGGPPSSQSPGFGSMEDVLADFGHPHDDSPASSLDPETRATLKKAVDEMWQSEMQLRQGHPDLALPFAYRALRFIKEVQQATRVFLSRVGPELPPIDASRRMTGKRDGLASRTLPVAPVESGDGPVADAWRALGDGPGAVRGPILLDALDRWVRGNGTRLPDALALAGAIDAVRQEPGCMTCRVKLRALLWSAMERPTARIVRRAPPGSMGNRYLGAIGDVP